MAVLGWEVLRADRLRDESCHTSREKLCNPGGFSFSTPPVGLFFLAVFLLPFFAVVVVVQGNELFRVVWFSVSGHA